MKPNATMLELRFGYFPQKFAYNRNVYHVKQIERTQTTEKELNFIVKTDSGEWCSLSQNVKNKTWTCRMIKR